MKKLNKLILIFSLIITNIVPISSVSETTVPLTACDRDYQAAEESNLLELNTNELDQYTVDPDIARKYMNMLKQYQDISLKIINIEDNMLSNSVITTIRVPFYNYKECLTDASLKAVSSKVCEQSYKLSMQETLSKVQSLITNSRDMQITQDYMALLKQQYSLERKIDNIEGHTLTTYEMAKLRKPLEVYKRCLGNTKNYFYSNRY